MNKTLYWIRQDLRVNDNPALWHAAQQGQCVAVVILSPLQWQNHDDAICKINLYLRQLIELQQSLYTLNIPLLVKTIDLWCDIPAYLVELSKKLHINDIYANIDNGVNESLRDSALHNALYHQNKRLHLFQDKTLFPLASLRNKQQMPYQVFSAFKKLCYAYLNQRLPALYPDVKVQSQFELSIADQSENISDILKKYAVPDEYLLRWPTGEIQAQQRLADFIDNDVHHYHIARDYPAQAATSKLSAYINMGILSVRQCLHALMLPYAGEFHLKHKGEQIWLDEILWREFYQHLLFDFAKLSKHLPFKDETDQIAWRTDNLDFEKWTAGQTGIPIVDAGMRELKQTGWMHNRVRMICAMFLSKNLLIDWRKGEKWFMQHLIDGDLAANNGGWQWCASTGTDAVPYFRIFNPVLQSKRFDPDGIYIKTWLPELASIESKYIHEPYAQKKEVIVDYPPPMLDLKMSRERALTAFKTIKR